MVQEEKERRTESVGLPQGIASEGARELSLKRSSLAQKMLQ